MYDLYNLVQCWLWQRWNHRSIIVTIDGDKWRCVVPGQGKELAEAEEDRHQIIQQYRTATVPSFKHPIVLYSGCAALLVESGRSEIPQVR